MGVRCRYLDYVDFIRERATRPVVSDTSLQYELDHLKYALNIAKSQLQMFGDQWENERMAVQLRPLESRMHEVMSILDSERLMNYQ